MIKPFVSAGHHLKDPGAVSGSIQENKETIKLRDLVIIELRVLYGLDPIVMDQDTETLAQYLQRIRTGSGSVVCEFHFDASGTGKGTGTTAIVGDDATIDDKNFASEMATAGATIMGIKNRGVITEAQSHRGRLGLMRKAGIVSLVEVCFLDNPDDMAKYKVVMPTLAKEYARIIKKYDDLIE